jgi:UPF0716 protein FxsA
LPDELARRAFNVEAVIRLVLFVVVPVVELVLLAVIGDAIGFGWTALIVLVTGLLGARLVARQGRQVWREIMVRLNAGQMPGVELAHGAMVLVGGAFLITPGVLTDLFGLLLMVPWIRELLRVRFFNTMRVIVL